MNYLIDYVLKNNYGINLEIAIAVLIVILLFLSIIILTIIKKLKDK